MFIIIIHNSQKVKAAQVSTDRWINKENMLYRKINCYSALKKEGKFDIHYNIDEL